MELPQRKRLRLQDFDYSQNGAYFITVCTRDRKKILSDIVGDDAHIVPKPCGKVVEKYICNVPEITKYVIMPNHIHMLIEIGSGTMWASSPTSGKVASIVRSIKTLTTKEIGASVFQRSYYDHIIRNEQDYLEIWRYIDENPVKWQLDEFYE
ncbi:MAG: transposase [Oscillospiraceae bacterium]|nr:transposase [Oscillospiraceae bacterium]